MQGTKRKRSRQSLPSATTPEKQTKKHKAEEKEKPPDTDEDEEITRKPGKIFAKISTLRAFILLQIMKKGL